MRQAAHRGGSRGVTPVRALSADLDRLRAQIGGLESRHVAALGPRRDRAEPSSRSSRSSGRTGSSSSSCSASRSRTKSSSSSAWSDYRESNTRFLLVHDNWRGLIVDSGQQMHRLPRVDGPLLASRHPRRSDAFVDRDNVNELIRRAGIEGDIGLLSIDLDGNDYWILEAIDVVSPRILVAEYNSTSAPRQP